MEYKNTRRAIILPIMLSAAVVGGFFLGLYHPGKTKAPQTSSETNIPKEYAQPKIKTIVDLVNAVYVEPIDIDSLTEEFISPMLEKLDPHSVYIPAKNVQEANEDLEGEFEGIGVMFNMLTDTVIIQSVISGGPSAQAGILAGDRIITIGDSLVAGKKINQNNIVKMLKGKGGTTVRLGIERWGQQELLSIDVVRGKIPIKSIDAAFMLEPGIGYVKLLRFSRFSHKEMVEAINRLRSEGMKTLILDLRNNPGGYMDQANAIAQEFLEKDKLIVYTEGKRYPKSMKFSDGKGQFINQELVVLIDEGSASSSEIVAGAIQDNDRGTIIGRRSFGKGLVQQQIPLSDGSVINLTIARYYTPTGRCIQRPYDKGAKEYRNDILNRYYHSELISRDSIKLPDSLKYTTPGGKIVYGGGGIMPDVFVPLDTTNTAFTREVWNNNKVFRFLVNYNERHRQELKNITTFDQANAYFDQHIETIYRDMVAHAAANGIDTKEAQTATTRKYVLPYIKAYIARSTPLDENGFYYFIYPINDIMLESVEYIKQQSTQQ